MNPVMTPHGILDADAYLGEPWEYGRQLAIRAAVSYLHGDSAEREALQAECAIMGHEFFLGAMKVSHSTGKDGNMIFAMSPGDEFCRFCGAVRK